MVKNKEDQKHHLTVSLIIHGANKIISGILFYYEIIYYILLYIILLWNYFTFPPINSTLPFHCAQAPMIIVHDRKQTVSRQHKIISAAKLVHY